MSAPIATSAQLDEFLGMGGTIDAARADFLIGLAQTLCESIVSPITDSALPVVLGVAGRAYTNVTSAHQVSLGSGSVAFGAPNSQSGVGGLYLSREDKRTLRRLAGRAAAFSADVLPTGVDEVQAIAVAATTGTFTISFQGAITSPLAFNASAADVQSALQSLTSIGSGGCAVTGSWLVEFTGSLATSPLPMLVADGSGLAGGTVSVSRVTAGVFAPGQDLAPWNRDYSPNYLPGPVVYP